VGDGGKQAWSPGRARRKPLKPLRAGMPGDSGVLVVTRVRSTTTKCTRGRGCNGHPAFPTPSQGRKIHQRLGRIARRDRKGVSENRENRTPSFRDGPQDQTSDVQLHIGESRDSGFDASHRPGMTASELSVASLLARTVILRESGVSSTPWLLASIIGFSGILDRPLSRATTAENLVHSYA
jgi:hypothetical protein